VSSGTDITTKLLEPTIRRVRLMVSRAILSLIDTSGGRVSIQASLLAGEVTDGVEYFEHYGFTSAPFPGAEGVFLAVGGARETGVIVATGDRRYHLRGLAAGEVAIFDDQGQKVHLTRGGIVIEGAGLPITVNNVSSVTVTAADQIDLDAPTVNLSGDLAVAGAITAQGDISDHGDKSMAGMRQVYDVHTHTDPQGGVTGAPSETM
jgi:phage baseplate assembly protein V